MSTSLLLSIQAFVTIALAGLIWTIQVVHYPLFASVPSGEFGEYARSHMQRIAFLVGPLMITELVVAIAILMVKPTGVPSWLVHTGAALVALLWLSTALVQGPIHPQLAREWSDARHAMLVHTNWVRTAAWTCRGVLSLAMIHAYWSAARGGG